MDLSNLRCILFRWISSIQHPHFKIDSNDSISLYNARVMDEKCWYHSNKLMIPKIKAGLALYTMMFLRILFTLSITANALSPGRLPNGELHRYTTNKLSPSSDLKSVEKMHAVLVTKHWLNNIAVQQVIPPEDEHIVKRIERLQEFAKQAEDPCHVYLIWIPAGAMQNILFVVLVLVEGENVTPQCIVPSPFWDSSQIGSYKLKRSLQHLAEAANRTLELGPLYKNDPWYKLSWNNWGDE